jgi:hypothetical protein
MKLVRSGHELRWDRRVTNVRDVSFLSFQPRRLRQDAVVRVPEISEIRYDYLISVKEESLLTKYAQE